MVKRYNRFDRTIQRSDWEKRREQGNLERQKLLQAQMAAGATVHLAVLTVCTYCRSKNYKTHNGKSDKVLCGKDVALAFRTSYNTNEVNCSECLAGMDEGLESGLLEPDADGKIQDLTESVKHCYPKWRDQEVIDGFWDLDEI